jgi:hypothetical protein
MHNLPQVSINKSNFGKMFPASWCKSATVGNALEGFQYAVFYPYKPRVLSYDKFLPSTHYTKGDSEPETRT